MVPDGAGNEWLCVFGGLRDEGFRDNMTFLLGPLGPAAGAAGWKWTEVLPAPAGHPQAPGRPEPRFHHTVTAVGHNLGDERLWRRRRRNAAK